MPGKFVILFSPTEPKHPTGKTIISVIKTATDVKLRKDAAMRCDFGTEEAYMGIEIKTAQGLYDDVVSDRLDHQVPELLQDWECPVILTVGRLGWHADGMLVDGHAVRRFPWVRFQRKLAHAGWGGMTLLWAKSPREAGQTVLGLLRSVMKRPFEPWKEQRHFPPILPTGVHDGQANFLARIPGVGEKRARALLDTFGSASAVIAGLYPNLSTDPDAVGWAYVDGIGRGTMMKATQFLEAEA